MYSSLVMYNHGLGYTLMIFQVKCPILLAKFYSVINPIHTGLYYLETSCDLEI